jgi:hypothetical protein
MTQQVNVTIRPDVYLGQFQQRLATHRSNLRGILHGIEDGSFIEKTKSARPGAVIQIDLGRVPIPTYDAIAEACNRCFLDIMRALVTYLDRIIACRRAVGAQLRLPAEGRTTEDFREFFEKFLEQKYQEVAKDTNLTNPKKVAALVNLGSYERDTVLSYFQLRRCLEHHGAVAAADITVHFSRLVISAAGEEIKSLPYRAPENTSIEARFERGVLAIPKGTKAALNETDIENICVTLQLLIAPNV